MLSRSLNFYIDIASEICNSMCKQKSRKLPKNWCEIRLERPTIMFQQPLRSPKPHRPRGEISFPVLCADLREIPRLCHYMIADFTQRHLSRRPGLRKIRETQERKERSTGNLAIRKKRGFFTFLFQI